MSRRWVCPRCGAGVLAPDKPRRDDARRYCLDCTRTTGRLVERSCPALDRQREIASTRAAAKRATATTRQRERARAARSIGRFDLDAEARRFWRLPSMVELHGGTRLPEITIRRSRSKRYSSGHAWTYTTTITVGTNAADALYTLLHELVHCAILRTRGGHLVHHGPKYKAYLMACAAEAWPTVDFRWHETDGWTTYQIGYRIVESILPEIAESVDR
jgi:hypothetical protein